MDDFLNLDGVCIDIPCPGCGHKFEESIARLKGDPQLSCPACGISFCVQADALRKGLKAAEKAISDLRATLRKTFKQGNG